MWQYIVRRLLQMLPVLALVTFLVHALMLAIPGDPVRALIGPGEVLDEEQIALIREQHHLDEPVIVQYGIWLGKAVQGDLGRSTQNQRPVAEELGSRALVTPAIRHRRLAHGPVRGRAGRHRLGGVSRPARGLRGDGAVHRRRGDTELLVRHHGHPAVRRHLGLAADPRLRGHLRRPGGGPAPHGAAGFCAGASRAAPSSCARAVPPCSKCWRRTTCAQPAPRA